MSLIIDLYLIRHGRSGASSRRQGPKTQLSTEGRWQALRVARRLPKVDQLLTSPLVRAEESARIIGDHLGTSPIIKADLREIDRPGSVYGASHDGEPNQAYKAGWKTALGRTQLDWKFEGEGESLRELILRVHRIRQELETSPGKKIAVVSHSVLLAFLISDLLATEKKPENVARHATHFFLKHGGLAQLRFDNGRWSIVHFDYSK